MSDVNLFSTIYARRVSRISFPGKRLNVLKRVGYKFLSPAVTGATRFDLI